MRRIKLTKEVIPMLKLMIEEKDRAVQNAIAPLRWCVEREVIEELKQRGIRNPHLLLLIFHLGDAYIGDNNDLGYYEYWSWRSNMERKLIPLDRLMDYVQFQRSGKHRIIATIVGGNATIKNRYLYKRFLWSGDDCYLPDFRLVNQRGRLDSESISSYMFNTGNAEIDIVVPDGLFANEPPEWEKKWVNLWYESPAKDQCHYRKRRLLAYTIKPPLALMWYSFIILVRYIAAAFLLMCGMKRIDFGPLIHPISSYTDYIWWDVQWPDSVFIPKLKAAGVNFYPAFSAAPIITVPVFALAAVVSHSALIGAIAALGVAIIPSLFTLVFIALFGIGLESIASLARLIIERKFTVKGKEVKKPETHRYENDDLLICTENYTPSINTLPANRRTVYLRYMNFKAKWCRPFAR